MKTFEQFTEEIEEQMPVKAKYDKSPEAKLRRKKDKIYRIKNKAKIKQAQKKRNKIMKTTASKNKEAQMAKRGLTRTGKRKKVFVNKI